MGNMFHRKGAYLFGKYSKEIGRVRNSPVIAVFFRDGDGTRSTPLTEWQSKFKSVVSGFEASEFPAGVPMIPRPKSEAWMLCGLFKHENPACDCAWLEEESGNDGSPKSLKGQLGAHLSGADSAEEQAYLVKNGRIDPEQIDLPSFEAFKTALDAAFVNCRMPE